MNELERLRARIDALDAKIVSLLNRRAVAVRAVGEFKRERGLPVLDASRERRIYERLRGLSKGPLRPDDVERMFRALIAEYRRFEAVAPAGPARNPASPRASVAIVGMGLIGGSLAKALRRSGKWRVIGLPGPRVRANRELRAAAHVLAADPAAALTADLVVLAAPLAAIERFIKEWGPRARPGSVWTDVGSAKESVLRAARAHLAPGAEFVGGHPMAG
ncbi:MAG TPA: prephenate dehydrogenase/arogenate dehydrogenase family protein, partial [Elusimicrobiota bacterium]|nr:prephenate dehydrogenase/arogenate dehydrogenase family protein [Elusimicrobiota bacterium]